MHWKQTDISYPWDRIIQAEDVKRLKYLELEKDVQIVDIAKNNFANR